MACKVKNIATGKIFDKDEIEAHLNDFLSLSKKIRNEKAGLSEAQTGNEGQINQPEGAETNEVSGAAPSSQITEVRHATTAEDDKGVTSGPTNVKLNAEGKDQADQLSEDAQGKGIQKVVSSTLDRGVQTAKKVAEKLGVPHEQVAGLDSWNIGDFDKMKDTAFKKAESYFVQHPDATEFEGKKLGESFNQYKDRVIEARTKLENENQGHTLLVNHGGNINIWDAFNKNGKEWNEQAGKDYLNAKDTEPAKMPESASPNVSVGDMVTSPHFEGERKVTHVGEDHVVVEDPGGAHIKHEIPITEIKTKDNASPIRSNSGQVQEGGNAHEGSENTRGQDIQPPTPEPPVNGETEQSSEGGQVIGTKNKVTAVIRAENGLPPVEIPADRKEDASLNAWKDGTRTPQQIIDQLLSGKDIYDKSITPNDEPIMREYIRGLVNRGIELNKLNESLNEKVKAGDEQAIADQATVRNQLLNHYDEMGHALDAERIGGNIWHKYGMERQLAVNEQGQVVNSINRIKAIYGDDIPPEIKKQLSDLQQKHDELQAKNAKLEEDNKTLQSENELLKQKKGAQKSGKKTDQDFVKERKDILSDMKEALKEANKKMYATAPGLPQLAAIAPHVLKLFKSFGEQGIIKLDEAVGKIHDLVKDVLEGITKEDIKNIIQGKYTAADQLKKQAEATQRKIDKGQFYKPPAIKRLWEKDPEWIKNNQKQADLKQKLRNLEQAAYDSKKNMYMKGLDWFNRWGRRIIFFGANAVYTKLSSAAVLGAFAHRIPETLLGKANAKMFPHIAKNAPIEGNLNATSEAKFYKEFLSIKKFAQNIWDQAKTGETPLSRELGRHSNEKHIPIVDLFAADAHAMIKDPVKRATFEAAVIAHLKFFADNSIDGTHPLMLESARQGAYKAAEYEIFQNSAKNAGGVKKFFNELEKSGIVNANMPDTWNKVKGNAQYTAASLYHFFVPINTVPKNILARVGLGLRTPVTMVEAMSKNKAIRDGILNMSQEESDLLMRQLKKGQIGTAYWTLGFILGGAALGGLYTKYDPDKERGNHPKINEMDIGDTNVPKDVQHNTQFQSSQMGATWKTVYNHFIDDKGASQMEAIAKATAATAGAAAESIPTIKAAAGMYEATQTPYAGEKWVKDLKNRVGIGKATSLMKMMGYDDDSETGGSGGGGGAGSTYKTKEWQ